MLNASTIYLIMAMVAFIFVAIVVIHQHNCSEQIRRKKTEIDNLTRQLGSKTEILEQEISKLSIKIEEIDDKINSFQP